jgi:hypothetical protein
MYDAVRIIKKTKKIFANFFTDIYEIFDCKIV